MPSKQRKDKNGETVADKVLKQYATWISEEVYKQYGLGKKDNNLPDIAAKKNAWISLHAWSQDKEEYIIDRTKLFLRLLDSTNSNSTNLQFLNALINRIISYLNYWFKKESGRTNAEVRELLRNALYNNNSYVRGLELYQAERRACAVPHTPQDVAIKKKRERIEAQKKQREISSEIHFMFVEVQALRKK